MGGRRFTSGILATPKYYRVNVASCLPVMARPPPSQGQAMTGGWPRTNRFGNNWAPPLLDVDH